MKDPANLIYFIYIFSYPQSGIMALREGLWLQKAKGFVSGILIRTDVILAWGHISVD